MIKINLYKIYGIDEFKKEEFIDLKKIKKIAQQQRGIYCLRSSSFANVRQITMLIKRALEIIKIKNINLDTDLEKQLFVNSFVFYDNEGFVETLKKYNIDINELKDLILKIYNYKEQGCHNIILNSNKFDLIRKHYNINNVEIVINKFFEILHYNSELLEPKKEKKKLY